LPGETRVVEAGGDAPGEAERLVKSSQKEEDAVGGEASAVEVGEEQCVRNPG
jgi:hypothetical protein